MPVIRYPLTPWGKLVTKAMIDRDINASALAAQLRDRGFMTTRTQVIGMMRGYRGARTENVKKTINEILEIAE